MWPVQKMFKLCVAFVEHGKLSFPDVIRAVIRSSEVEEDELCLSTFVEEGECSKAVFKHLKCIASEDELCDSRDGDVSEAVLFSDRKEDGMCFHEFRVVSIASARV